MAAGTALAHGRHARRPEKLASGHLLIEQFPCLHTHMASSVYKCYGRLTPIASMPAGGLCQVWICGQLHRCSSSKLQPPTCTAALAMHISSKAKQGNVQRCDRRAATADLQWNLLAAWVLTGIRILHRPGHFDQLCAFEHDAKLLRPRRLAASHGHGHDYRTRSLALYTSQVAQNASDVRTQTQMQLESALQHVGIAIRTASAADD